MLATSGQPDKKVLHQVTHMHIGTCVFMIIKVVPDQDRHINIATCVVLVKGGTSSG